MKINKFIIIILILFLIINISINTYANDIITTTLPSIDTIVNDNDNWFIYRNPKSNSYFMIIYDGSILYNGSYFDNVYYEGEYYFGLSGGSHYRNYKLQDNTWILSSELFVEGCCPKFTSFEPLPNICASNLDIRNNKDFLGNDDLVFQESPTLSTLRGINFRPMVWEIMKMTIAGFLKYLIVFLVSLIAFWKGWQFLLKQLRKA